MSKLSEGELAELCSLFVERLQTVVGTDGKVAPLHEPRFAGEEWTFVKDCLDSGWVSSVGSYVDQFEQDLATACGVEHAVVLVNGTAALEIALRVGGVCPGDEVLIPTLTFVATANAVSHAGAIPHFVDSAFDTLGMDPARLRTYLESIATTRDGKLVNTATDRPITAIVPMHVFGHPVDMDGLSEVAKQFNLPIIADAAEALGSNYQGKPVASFGDISALSFNGNKIITTGGGGAIVTNSRELATRAKHITTTAKVPHRWAYTHDEIAFNYRMPNLNAALGCAQLAQLPTFLEQQREIAKRYAKTFSNTPGFSIFGEPANSESNYWLNAVLLSEDNEEARDSLLNASNDVGLHCRPVWTTLHRLPIYSSCPRMDLRVAEVLERRIINLPSSTQLAERPDAT
tara:strand:+ start:33472 stop:34677 length:1206 start_codon:yes stop_codon:yes gene_type:complete